MEVQHVLVVTAVVASVGAGVGTASLILSLLFRVMAKLR
jgi:multisubunit Na+/H+ antiporter MnhC subunit